MPYTPFIVPIAPTAQQIRAGQEQMEYGPTAVYLAMLLAAPEVPREYEVRPRWFRVRGFWERVWSRQ